MRLVLCHTCWSWVSCLGTACPDCHDRIDVTQPDPTDHELARQLGEGLARIATICLARPGLPSTGVLIGTTEGLLFLPYLRELSDGSLVALVEGGRPRGWWSWWRTAAHDSSEQSRSEQAKFELPEEFGHVALASELVRGFLNAPGAVFVPRPQIVRLHVRSRSMTLTRLRGTTLQWTLQSPPHEWQAAWRQLVAAAPEWQTLLPG